MSESGKVNSMRLVMVIGRPLNAELYDHLMEIPSRARGERLRLLATLGMMMLDGRLAAIPSGGGEDSTPPPPSDPDRQARDRLRSRLLARVAMEQHNVAGD